MTCWSSMKNKTTIVELEMKHEFANFDGVQLNTLGIIFIFHKGLIFDNNPPRTRSNLDSLERDFKLKTLSHHRHGASANLEVFDVPQKGQARKIYTFEEALGSTGIIIVKSKRTI